VFRVYISFGFSTLFYPGDPPNIAALGSQKIEVISRNYSSLFTRIRRFKSKREANIQRYIMLVLLILSVVLGAVVTHMGISLIVK